MPLYETRVRVTTGGQEQTVRIYAQNLQEARRLFEQQYGGPRAVPYVPRVVPG